MELSGLDGIDLTAFQSVTLPPISFDTDKPLTIRDKFLAQTGGRIDRKEIRRRAGEAMQRNLPHHRQCINTAKEWAIVGGGPSINDEIGTIRKLSRRGVNIVSVNKSHDWLLEHDIVPWAHILLDPKEWVKDYVKRPRKDVRYFVSSQCHDSVFEALKDYPVFLWHAGQDFPEGPEPNCYLKEMWPTKPWFIVAGPTTVGMRAMYLGSNIGAEHFHLFGMDSSRTRGKLHGYEKPEAPDATSGALTYTVNGIRRTFETNSHMARQQMDFDKMLEDLKDLVRKHQLPRNFEVTVYGYGLLPFFAATRGLHANPEYNRDPTLVPGYLEQESVAA